MYLVFGFSYIIFTNTKYTERNEENHAKYRVCQRYDVAKINISVIYSIETIVGVGFPRPNTTELIYYSFSCR